MDWGLFLASGFGGCPCQLLLLGFFFTWQFGILEESHLPSYVACLLVVFFSILALVFCLMSQKIKGKNWKVCGRFLNGLGCVSMPKSSKRLYLSGTRFNVKERTPKKKVSKRLHIC